MDSYIRVKIMGRNKVYKIKKLPVLFGSGKNNNILPLEGAQIQEKHGKLFYKNGKLYYEDISDVGTKVNGKIIQNNKELLNIGTNHLQIGKNKILIDNIVSIEKTLDSSIFQIKWVRLLTYILIPIMFLGAFSLFYFKSEIFGGDEYKLNNFNIDPKVLSANSSINIESVEFNPRLELDSSFVFTAYLEQESNIDTLNLMLDQNFNFKPFLLPNQFIRESILEDTLKLTLEVHSKIHEIKNIRLSRKYYINNRTKIEEKENITVKSSINGKVFSYTVTDTANKVKNYFADFGDGMKQEGSSTATNLYDNKGQYNFKLDITLKNSSKISFERLVIVE